MNIDKKEIRGKHSDRQKTAVINKYGENNTATKVLKNQIDRLKREKDTAEKDSKETMDNNSRKSRRKDSVYNSKNTKTNALPPVVKDPYRKFKKDRQRAGIPPVSEEDKNNSKVVSASRRDKGTSSKIEDKRKDSVYKSKDYKTNALPSVVEDLFRKLKTDRERAGIPLVFEEDKDNPGVVSASSRDKGTFSNIVRAQNIKQEPYGPKPNHRPSTPPIARSTPSTPSSFCLSPWDELQNDTDTDIDDRKTSTINSPISSPERRESMNTGSAVDINLHDYDLPIVSNSRNNESQLSKTMEDDDWPDDKTLAECNMYMLTNTIKTDVTILVGKQQDVILAHSFILTNRSPEFARLLNSSSYIKSNILTLNTIRKDVAEQIIRYIYTDDADLTSELALAIIPATGHLGPKALRTKCFRYLLSDLTSDTVCIILEYALQFEETEIYDKCLSFIHVNANDVFNSDSFGDLSPKCIDVITKSDDLNCDEYSVFDALIMWADKQCVKKQLYLDDLNRRDLLGLMIFNVRFATLDIEGFTANISHRDILKAEERMEIFQTFHDKTGDLPEHLNIHPRRKYNIKKEFSKENKDDSPPMILPRDIPRMPSLSRIADADLPIRRVVRFQNFGSTWEMTGADCIAFRVSSPIVFRGVQIFGPEKSTSPYTVGIKLYDDTKNIVREDKVLVEPSPGKIINDIVLNEPTRIPSNRFFTIQLMINSEPTKEGAEGVKLLDAGGVIFEFRNGENCSPRTNVDKGQVPSIIYSKISH